MQCFFLLLCVASATLKLLFVDLFLIIQKHMEKVAYTLKGKKRSSNSEHLLYRGRGFKKLVKLSVSNF